MPAKLLALGLAFASLPFAASPAAAHPPGEAQPGVSACPARAGWTPAFLNGERDPQLRGAVFNWLAVGPDGALNWNGAPVDPGSVAFYLGIVAAMSPRPLLVVAPERGAGCTELLEAAAFVEANLECEPSTCWLSAPASASAAPLTPSPPPERR